MTLSTRILPTEELARLEEIKDGADGDIPWERLGPSARVVVVEREGKIVGCHALVPVLHAECLWVHPEYRGKAAVPRRLWNALRATAREEFGVQSVATTAISDDIRRLLEHVQATKLDGDHYMVSVEEK
jgi:ribosomal protein S18 acetylase RimI-like enzyme